MAIVTVGDTEWEAQPDWSLTINDRGGADTLSRSYSGNAETLADFLSQYPKNSQDEEFPQLRRESVNVSGSRSFPTVTINYRGIFNDDLPEVRISGGWRRQTVTLIMQDDSSTVDQREDSTTQCTVVYFAPVSTYKYVTRIKPKKQRFEGKLELTDVSWQIRSVVGAGNVPFYEAKPPLWVAGIVTGGQIRPGHFNYVRAVGTTIFTFEQAGDYWEVVEENEGRMEMVERADLPRLLTSRDVMEAQDEEGA